MPQLPKLVAIVGPTASGKSSLAIELALQLEGEIINADSRQIYTGMEIGTAAPSAADRALVPHHLYTMIAPDEPFSLVTYLRLARTAIGDVVSRRRVPILVGGTGQYVWALLEGWQVPEVPPVESLRSRLAERARAEGPHALHAELAQRDPAAAARIHPHNVRRVIRALEVLEHAGPSHQRVGKSPPPFSALILAIHWDRPALYRRIDERLEDMLAAGWVDEVKRLLDAGYGPDLPSMTSLGYREIAAYLRGELTYAEAVERTKWSMHRLARMQATWFRRNDPRIHWVDGEHPSAAIPLAESFLTRPMAGGN